MYEVFLDYAGKYLRVYENERYTVVDMFDRPRITVPYGAVEFPDVSFYQGTINWDMMDANVGAIILRIGQNTWVDTQFERNYTEAKKRGIKVGGYWFFDGRVSATQQANAIKSVMTNKTLDMELFIDWERNYGGMNEGLPEVVSLMQACETVKCKSVGMYTGYYYFFDNTSPTVHASQYTYLKQHPLWLAWYAAASQVKVPAPWSEWTHWQYGTPAEGAIHGCSSVEIDMNNFNGNIAAFEARYGGTVTTPPTGVTMTKGLMLNYTVNVRNSGNVIATQLKVGDVVYGNVMTDTRERITFTKIYRAGGLIENLGGPCTAATNNAATPLVYYMTLMTNEAEPGTPPPPPPVSDIAGVSFSGEVVFDYTDGRQEVYHVTDVPMVKGPAA